MRLFYLCIGLAIPCLVVHQIGRDLISGQEASWQDRRIFIMPIILSSIWDKAQRASIDSICIHHCMGSLFSVLTWLSFNWNILAVKIESIIYFKCIQRVKET